MKLTDDDRKLLIAALDHYGRANGYTLWPRLLEMIGKINEEPEQDG